MSNINKTVIDSRVLSLDLLNKAVEAGLLSVLIAPTQIKFFMPTVVVAYAPLGDKTAILAENLRRKAIPFAAADKGLRPTLGSIPADHLAGRPVVEKVYGPLAPATRPVVKPVAGAPAPELPGVTEAAPEPAPKKKRAPRAKKAGKAEQGAADQAVG